ncbi:hypothetical protein CMK22_01785 [Candidatus Poribacteria bacterium]|nr:hypothetical protein [Candidatus Poribacteria bacterium]
MKQFKPKRTQFQYQTPKSNSFKKSLFATTYKSVTITEQRRNPIMEPTMKDLANVPRHSKYQPI